MLTLVAEDDRFEQRAGDQVKKLAENAGYLRQGWVLVGLASILPGMPPYPIRTSPFRDLS